MDIGVYSKMMECHDLIIKDQPNDPDLRVDYAN